MIYLNGNVRKFTGLAAFVPTGIRFFAASGPSSDQRAAASRVLPRRRFTSTSNAVPSNSKVAVAMTAA